MRMRAARPLPAASGIVAEIGGAGDEKAAAARPKKGRRLPSRPACRAWRLSAELGTRGGGGEGGRGTGRRGGIRPAAPQPRRALFRRSGCAPPCAPPRRAARVVGARLGGPSCREASGRAGREEGAGIRPSTAANCAPRAVGACRGHAMAPLPGASGTRSAGALGAAARKSPRGRFCRIMDRRPRPVPALRAFRAVEGGGVPSGLEGLTRGAGDLTGGMRRRPDQGRRGSDRRHPKDAAAGRGGRRRRARRSPRPPVGRSGRAGTGRPRPRFATRRPACAGSGRAAGRGGPGALRPCGLAGTGSPVRARRYGLAGTGSPARPAAAARGA